MHSLLGIRSAVYLVAVLAVSSGLSACKREGDATRDRSPTVPVRVAPVVAKAMPVEVRAVGAVEAFSTVEVVPQVGGEILKVHFKEGQPVDKDALLFTIDTRPYRASLAEARARLAKDQALAKQAKDEADRYGRLLKEGLVTKQEYERARSSASAAEATLKADRAAIAGASVDVSYSTIRAPISGRTGTLLVHAGNVVKPNDQTLVTIRKVNPIYVRFAIPEEYLAKLRELMKAGPVQVNATLPSRRDKQVTGTLTFIENTVDASTGTIALKAEFQNDDDLLWPGVYVDVALRLGVEQRALVVPEPAVQAGQEGDHVFVISAQNKASLRSVRVLRQVGSELVLAKGVKPGELVVTDGQVRLTPGASVEVLAAPKATPSAAAPDEVSE